MGLKLNDIVGVAAAPFTGGASLLLTSPAQKMLGDITGSTEAADAARAGVAGAERSTQKNIDFQKWLWGEQKSLSEPWRAAGETALNKAGTMAATPYTGADITSTPGYQFKLSEGLKGVENSLSARGMSLSGAGLKDITRFGQDYAAGEFQAGFNRRQTQFQNLFNIAGMGQAAAAGQASQGGQMGAQVGSAINQQGQLQMDLANINAAQAQSGWNNIMQMGNIAAATYGGKGWGA